MKYLLLALLLIPLESNATLLGKFDFSPVVEPLALYEIHDKQVLAGATKSNLWHLDYTDHKEGTPDASSFDGQRFHFGIYSSWDANHGNPSYGPILGLDVPLDVALAMGIIGDKLNLPATFKPAEYASSLVSVDWFTGYRPLDKRVTYGVAARLKVKFGISEAPVTK